MHYKTCTMPYMGVATHQR